MATLAQLSGNDPEEKEKQLGGGTAAGVASPVAPVPATGAGAPQTAQSNQGSGRFTNINKYINANKGAGQEIGARIGQGVNRSLDTSAAGAEEQANAFKQGVQKANESNTQGQQFLGLLNGQQQAAAPQAQQQPQMAAQPAPGPGQASIGQPPQQMSMQGPSQQLFGVPNSIEALAADQDAIRKFVNYRSGNEANTQAKALNESQAASGAASQKAAQDLAQRQQQLGTEQNRGGLLSEFVGSPGGGYSKGAQRLDQAFLQRDKNQSINTLTQALKDQEQGRFKSIADNTKALQDQAKTAVEGSGKLATDLGAATQNQFQKQAADMQAQMQATNQQRTTDANQASQQIAALLDNDPNTTVDEAWLQKLGLSQGQRTYGALGQLSQSDIAEINPSLGTLGQTSNAEQIARFNALNRLAGTNLVDNQLQYDPSAELTKGDLGAAVQYTQGDKSVASKIAAQKKIFEDAAAGANPFMGSAEWGGSFATEQQALQDYLKGGSDIQRGHSETSFGGTPFSGRGGVSMENVQQAEALAAQDRIRQMNAFLDKYGYRETLGGGGRNIIDSYAPDANQLVNMPKVK